MNKREITSIGFSANKAMKKVFHSKEIAANSPLNFDANFSGLKYLQD